MKLPNDKLTPKHVHWTHTEHKNMFLMVSWRKKVRPRWQVHYRPTQRHNPFRWPSIFLWSHADVNNLQNFNQIDSRVTELRRGGWKSPLSIHLRYTTVENTNLVHRDHWVTLYTVIIESLGTPWSLSHFDFVFHCSSTNTSYCISIRRWQRNVLVEICWIFWATQSCILSGSHYFQMFTITTL